MVLKVLGETHRMSIRIVLVTFVFATLTPCRSGSAKGEEHNATDTSRPALSELACPALPDAATADPQFMPRQVFYTGKFDPDLRNLLWQKPGKIEPGSMHDAGYPADMSFFYYNDTELEHSMFMLDKILSKAGVTGAFDAFRSLKPYAFKADLWRYSMLWACGGVYIDGKMKLSVDFEKWLKMKWHTTQSPQLLTCKDQTGTAIDAKTQLQRYDSHNETTLLWQGFLISTPAHPLLLSAIGQAIKYIQAKYYPDEGVLSALYITGPGLLGRLLKAARRNEEKDAKGHAVNDVEGQGWTVHFVCEWGNHGMQLVSHYPKGDIFMMADAKLHEGMRGKVKYSDKFNDHDVYFRRRRIR